MADKLHKTKGIVLRTVKYGETSVIVTIYTSSFGVQSYIVNGVRAMSKKGQSRSGFFQPAAILDLVVYHHETRNLNRIREYHWAVLYNEIFSAVLKNAISLFVVELVLRTVRQPETNEDLFHFLEDILLKLDEADEQVAANIPLFFALHFPVFMGLRIDDNYSSGRNYLDLMEGSFVADMPSHPHFLEGREAEITSELLRVTHTEELRDLKLNRDLRRKLMHAYEQYYLMHVQDFTGLRTIPVLKELLD